MSRVTVKIVQIIFVVFVEFLCSFNELWQATVSQNLFQFARVFRIYQSLQPLDKSIAFCIETSCLTSLVSRNQWNVLLVVGDCFALSLILCFLKTKWSALDICSTLAFNHRWISQNPEYDTNLLQLIYYCSFGCFSVN